MDKESIIERQKIDCNCSDCKFMVRDLDKHVKSVEFHKKMQLDYFTGIYNKAVAKANEHKDRYNDLEKWDDAHKVISKMKFVFDKSAAMINFGYCNKFGKDVTFIPNHLQLDTQKCFEHRKDNQMPIEAILEEVNNKLDALGHAIDLQISQIFKL